MKRNLVIASLLAVMAVPAHAEPAASATTAAKASAVPAQLDAAQAAGYRTVFAAIHDGRWQDAQITLDTMTPGPLHPLARAELYTAKGSPRVELPALVDLLNQAPELPQAEALRRIASARGAVGLPPLPVAQRLIWQDGAPRRVRAKPTRSDEVAAALAIRMQPFIKADDGAAADALLAATTGLSPEATSEWQARVAWMYFLSGNDARVRTLGMAAAGGSGEWAVQGRWMAALSAWRQNDCAAAADGFGGVAARAGDVDLRAAGLYWAARADMACARPDRVEARLKTAAQFGESFYGQLARQALGMRDRPRTPSGIVAADWPALARRPNVRVAAALVEVGENDLADDVLRQQARIGDPAEFAGLVRLAETLDLPATTIWLAHNCPQGVVATADARYPTPGWTPDSGWRVDKALVYAHTLEESRFRAKVTSQAGAYGLMQIMPAAAIDFARERGLAIDKASLSRPSVNIDVGQRHLERLRDMMGVTGGYLPKVIAAYNAGPKPVGEWNSIVHDGGDPLLYIESIPYWETRGYVTTVLRNYWMYEAQSGKPASTSRTALAQGLWPRFPGLSGAQMVRMERRGVALAAVPVMLPSTPGVAPMAPTMAAASVRQLAAAGASRPVARAIAPRPQLAAPPAAALAERNPAVSPAAMASVMAPLREQPAVPPARAAAMPGTSPTPATVVQMARAIPGAVVAAATAMTDGDMLRRAAAAMAMQPRAMVQSVTAAFAAATKAD